MDRSWMYGISRTSAKYLAGVEEFIKVAETHKEQNRHHNIVCPCKDCKNFQRHCTSDVRDHLICRGFKESYTCWIRHGERSGQTSTGKNVEQDRDQDESDDMNFIDVDHIEIDFDDNDELDISNDEMDINSEDLDIDSDEFDIDNHDNIEQMLHDVEDHFGDNYQEFEELFTASKEKLYPECTNFTKLSAVMKLFDLKASNGWSDKSFTSLLKVLRKMLPQENELPDSVYQAKKLVCPMGLEIERIHACPNDCVLYRNNYANLHSCPICGASRYKRKNRTDSNPDDLKNGPPAKMLWYLPIEPRLKRLFANARDAKLLHWHAEERKKDGKLRHPADSPQWRNINRMFEEIGGDPRNIRFGLSTDGMNPHGNMSSRHSTWPVLLCIYNLPPWLCMKRKYIMMSLLIQGPRQPGNDIDVYLAPLIEDLKKLWSQGIEVYDAYNNEKFTLRAMVFCTINDFPAYGNLSGYSTKGAKACPICEDDTQALWLKNCKKNVFMGHRRFLPKHHPYRKQKKTFNGKVEHGAVRPPLEGKEVYLRVKNLNVVLGKGGKSVPKHIWKKRSIFWDLPYWEHLQVRHCLDVMHIEKNVCDSLIGLLLNTPGKTKDGIKVRNDMVEMGIRTELAPLEKKGKRTYLPPACYTLSKDEKTRFCQCLHGVKVPSGYSSNIKKLVSMKDLKLLGMKSHDCHVLMTHMIPVAIRGILPTCVRETITKLCYFFNAINVKVIDPEMLDSLQREVIITLCQLEMYFPPSFFDVMVHLIVHIVGEIKACGPVFLRYMYPFERYMGILKGYVRNRYRPEGSIIEGYTTEEVIEFCNDYLAGVKNIGIPKSRHEGRLDGVGTIGSKVIDPDPDQLRKAHFFVLQNMTDVAPYIYEHMRTLEQQNPSKGEKWLTNEHNKTFAKWLKERVKSNPSRESVNETVKWLGNGPRHVVTSFQAYDINGYTFYTRKQDDKSTVSNSGVTLVASSKEFPRGNDARAVIAKNSYYGVIEEIWELNYRKFKIPLFRCQWVENKRGVKVDDTGFTLIDISKEGYKDDPFILARQAIQVFFVIDPKNDKWRIVLPGKRHIVGVENVVDEEEYDHFDELSPFSIGMQSDQPSSIDTDETIYMRSDHAEGIWVDQ